MAQVEAALKHDGFYRVSWVLTIANKSAPTVAELNAGLELECQLTPDGLGIEASDETVDTSRLCSTFSTMEVGRTGYEASLTLVRLDESGAVNDDAYNTLTKALRGHVVVRDNISGEVAWTAAQQVRVYPVQCGTRSHSTPAANEQMTFTLPLFVYQEPDEYAVVAA